MAFLDRDILIKQSLSCLFRMENSKYHNRNTDPIFAEPTERDQIP